MMKTSIDPRAIIEKDAKIGKGCVIGAGAYVGNRVVLNEGVTLHPYAYVTGNTEVGTGSVIYPYAVIGQNPQDLKYQGEDSGLIIGHNNQIREHVTIHTGTKGGGMITKIGNNNLIMVACHVAHDCQLGNNIIMANNATLGGHVVIDDYAVLGGLASVHQYCRIGSYAMVAAEICVRGDVPPYAMLEPASDGVIHGLNIIGLKRNNFHNDDIRAIKDLMTELFLTANNSNKTFAEKLKQYQTSENPKLQKLIDFFQNRSHRPLSKINWKT